MMWKDGDEQYYPNGVDDDDYCILEFIAEIGRYYRYDGIGNISHEEIVDYDKDSNFVDYYDSLT